MWIPAALLGSPIESAFWEFHPSHKMTVLGSVRVKTSTGKYLAVTKVSSGYNGEIPFAALAKHITL